MIKEAVFKWLQAGAPHSQGARLFSLIAGRHHPFNKLLQLNSNAVYSALKEGLCRRAGIGSVHSAPSLHKPAAPPAAPIRIREDWPFLQDPSCPPELKILAADKITAYQKYTAAHLALFDCTTPVEQFQAAKECVENYIANRLIVSEFKHFKEHKQLLGKHPIFLGLKKLKELRKLNVVQLIKLKENLEHSIWRIQFEIKKGDKQHLTIEREKRIQEKKDQLAEVERLIKEFTEH